MASPGFDSSDLNFLHEHVFEGIWEKYDESAYSRRIWTLQSYKVFFIMAALVILVEFVGSRSWVISRYVVLHMTGKPMRFPDQAHSEPLLHLSQGQAIRSSLPPIGKAFVQSWTRLRRIFRPSTTGQSFRAPHDQQTQDEPTQSVWFGIVAIFNLALFITMSIAIPALPTDGAFGAPIVRSKPVEECLTSNNIVGWVRYVMDLPRTDAIFQQGFDEMKLMNQACDSQYHFSSY